MLWLKEEMARRGLSQRDVGKRLGHANATRIGEYLTQRIVPGPRVLGDLANAIGVSPIEALWSAGRQEFVLEYLQALYELGWWWMKQDQIYLHPKDGAHFVPREVKESKEEIGPIAFDPSEIPADLTHRYLRVEVRSMAGVFHGLALPKPMACAILLAVGLFPRRGDQARAETQAFLEGLGRAAFAYIAAADRRRVPTGLRALRRPLRSAGEIVRLKFYGHDRLAIIAEYVHLWASFACRDFADYARVALCERGGLFGDLGDYGNIWEWQRAALPTLSEFGFGGELETGV